MQGSNTQRLLMKIALGLAVGPLVGAFLTNPSYWRENWALLIFIIAALEISLWQAILVWQWP